MENDEMGNIKTSYVKRMSRILLEKYPDRFGTDYAENKKAVKELVDMGSKKDRERHSRIYYEPKRKKQVKYYILISPNLI